MLPSWHSKESGGGKVRGALWLVTIVGVGNVFTKAQLRAAFPGDAQIDRRIRDLRDYGWRIDTNRDDPALKPEEQRFVTIGDKIWIPGQSRSPKHKNGLTATQRNNVLKNDGFLCRTCGIAAGESYGDGIELSKLRVARRPVRLANGQVDFQLVTECERCGAAEKSEPANMQGLLGKVKNLDPLERKVLAGWIKADHRTRSPLEQLWGIYRTLPAQSRQAFAQCVIESN